MFIRLPADYFGECIRVLQEPLFNKTSKRVNPLLDLRAKLSKNIGWAQILDIHKAYNVKEKFCVKITQNALLICPQFKPGVVFKHWHY